MKKTEHLDQGLIEYLLGRMDIGREGRVLYIRSGRGFEVADEEFYKTIFRFNDSGTLSVKRDETSELENLVFQGIRVPLSVGSSEYENTQAYIGPYLKKAHISANVIFKRQVDSDRLWLNFTHDYRSGLNKLVSRMASLLKR